MRTSGVTSGLVLAACLGLLAGCGGGAPNDSSETTQASDTRETDTATSSAPEDARQTSAGPTAAEPQDEGQADAAQAVVKAWALLDEARRNSEVPVQDLAGVARGQAVAQWVSNLQMDREEGLAQEGETVVTVTAVEAVAEGEDYQVTACLDWSDVTYNGEKPNRGELGDRQQITYRVGPDATSEGELFVTHDPMEYEPCGP